MTKHDVLVGFMVVMAIVICYGWVFLVWLATNLLHAFKDCKDWKTKADVELWSYTLYILAVIWIAILWWTSLPEGINAR